MAVTSYISSTGQRIQVAGATHLVLNLTDDGLAATADNHNANGDYSGEGAEEFYVGAPANTFFEVWRMVVFIQDDGVWRTEYYAGLGAALTVGVNLYTLAAPGGAILETFTPQPVLTSSSWAKIMYDVRYDTIGAGAKTSTGRFSFNKFGRPVVLQGTEVVAIRLNDDFEGIEHHDYVVEGICYTL